MQFDPGYPIIYVPQTDWNQLKPQFDTALTEGAKLVGKTPSCQQYNSGDKLYACKIPAKCSDIIDRGFDFSLEFELEDSDMDGFRVQLYANMLMVDGSKL